MTANTLLTNLQLNLKLGSGIEHLCKGLGTMTWMKQTPSLETSSSDHDLINIKA